MPTASVLLEPMPALSQEERRRKSFPPCCNGPSFQFDMMKKNNNIPRDSLYKAAVKSITSLLLQSMLSGSLEALFRGFAGLS